MKEVELAFNPDKVTQITLRLDITPFEMQELLDRLNEFTPELQLKIRKAKGRFCRKTYNRSDYQNVVLQP